MLNLGVAQERSVRLPKGISCTVRLAISNVPVSLMARLEKDVVAV
jgi:hypothetical protein